jgi:hypothetical protein
MISQSIQRIARTTLRTITRSSGVNSISRSFVAACVSATKPSHKHNIVARAEYVRPVAAATTLKSTHNVAQGPSVRRMSTEKVIISTPDAPAAIGPYRYE